MIFYHFFIGGLFEKGHPIDINFIKIKINIQLIYKLKLIYK